MTSRLPRPAGRFAWVGALALAAAALVPGAAMGAVPAPPQDGAVVTVRVGGDRGGADGSVAGLAGVRLGLYAAQGDPAPALECVSDADGDCSFVVEAGSGLLGTAPWVAALEAPAGWFLNLTLRTGHGSGSPSTASPYEFQTPVLAAGQTYRSTADFMRSADNGLPTRSGGTWQVSRENPTAALQCGLDIALVLDLSSSVGSELPTLIDAADQMVDALEGTPSRFAVFGFSALSPSVDRDTAEVYANHPDLVSVSTAAGAQAVQNIYAEWGLGRGTNWDQALYRVAEAAPDYDVAVVLTDGNPTRFGIDTLHGDGTNTHFTDVEEAVFSSNLVKAEGTRVISFGIGAGVEGITSLNLAAISGPTAFDGTNLGAADYYQIPTFEAAGDALRDLALATCGGSISVVKQVVPGTTTGEDIAGAQPAGAGWEFTAAPGAGDITVTPGSASTTDDATGAVSFDVAFESTEDPATVSLAELQRDGWSLVTQGGAHAVCTDLATGADVAVSNEGATGWSIPFAPEDAVSCTVYNRPDTAPVTVTKAWVVDGDTFAHGEQPDGLDATATLTGPDGAGASAQDFGVPRPGYLPGEEVTVDESVTVPEDCTLESATVTALNGQQVAASLPFSTTVDAEGTAVTLTNVVTCEPTTSPTPTPTPSPSASVEPSEGPSPSPTTDVDAGSELSGTGPQGVGMWIGLAAAGIVAGVALLAGASRRVRSGR